VFRAVLDEINFSMKVAAEILLAYVQLKDESLP
jgi:hypothetical protein